MKLIVEESDLKALSWCIQVGISALSVHAQSEDSPLEPEDARRGIESLSLLESKILDQLEEEDAVNGV